VRGGSLATTVENREPTMTETPTSPTLGTAARWNVTASSAVVTREDPFPWGLLLGLGITSILFGIIVLAWPDASLRLMAVLVGCWLLIEGVTRVLGAFLSGRGIGHQMLSGIVGVLLVVGGVACLRNLATGLAVLATIVALMWLFSGLSEIALAMSATGSTRVGMLVLGVASTIVGFALIVWPDLSLTTLVITTGISALFAGAGQVAFAFKLRKAALEV
jgi:uncharacterized membrane protein HdeD (DUF308 family)